MTPKENAQELTNKFAIYLRANLMYDEDAEEDAKQCALISMNETIGILQNLYGTTKEVTYYNEVKYEIEKL